MTADGDGESGSGGGNGGVVWVELVELVVVNGGRRIIVSLKVGKERRLGERERERKESESVSLFFSSVSLLFVWKRR